MPAPRITRSDLFALARKYRMLAEIRRSAELEADAEIGSRLLALGREFPGALGELEVLPLDEIDRRIEAIERGLETGTVETWVLWMCAYDRYMHAAFELRRLVAGRVDLARELAEDLARAAERETGFACDAELVIAIATARGSIQIVVLERLQRELGAPAASIRRALFPAPRGKGASWARI